MQQSSQQLLFLASIFEKRANNNIKHFIKKSSLDSLRNSLTSLLMVRISGEVFNDWIFKNISVLGDLGPYLWYYTYDSSNNEVIMGDSRSNRGTSVVISKVPYNEEDNFDISTSAILIEHDVIPKMFFTKIKYIQSNTLKDLPAELAHEEYLVKAISSIKNYRINSEVIKDILEFYNKNKSKINTLRKYFSYAPKYLGGGIDGAAFDISKNLVLKIFGDKFSYESALAAQNRIYKSPQLAKTEAMIYDIGELGSFENSPLYYSIMEKMTPIFEGTLTNSNKKINNLLFMIFEEIKPFMRDDKWLNMKKNIHNPKTHEIVKREVKIYTKLVYKNIKNNNQHLIDEVRDNYPNLTSNWLLNLIEEILVKWVTSRGDLHIGNIGVTNYGSFRYFDPAYWEWERSLNLPTSLL